MPVTLVLLSRLCAAIPFRVCVIDGCHRLDRGTAYCCPASGTATRSPQDGAPAAAAGDGGEAPAGVEGDSQDLTVFVQSLLSQMVSRGAAANMRMAESVVRPPLLPVA